MDENALGNEINGCIIVLDAEDLKIQVPAIAIAKR
jgi:hypothetical protein